MRRRMILIAGFVVGAVSMLTAQNAEKKSTIVTIEVVASGLDNPRGVAIGPDGAVYVAEAGRGGTGPCITNSNSVAVCYGATGAITRIGAFQVRRVADHLPSLAAAPGEPGAGTEAAGVHHIAFDEQGRGLAIIGLGANPALRSSLGSAGNRFGRLVRFRPFGGPIFDDDVAAYEASANPDGGAVDSNPYGLAVVRSGVVVADAGANAVLAVPDNRPIRTLAVFPNRLVPFGAPGNMVPMQAVPTAVTVGPGGALYIGQLTGFPFPAGGASVYRLESGGQPEVFASGFTDIVDLAFGRDGSLYVLQISKAGLLSGNPVGALIHVKRDGTRETIADGALIAPGGMAIGHDGSIYVSRFATMPGAGDVVRIHR